jgi:hypothetical protein
VALQQGLPLFFLTPTREVLPPLFQKSRSAVSVCAYHAQAALRTALEAAHSPAAFKCPF